MFSYEHRLSEIFPEIAEALVPAEPNMETLKIKAARYLDESISSSFGYQGQIHFLESAKPSIEKIPIVFDTALVLALLHSNTDIRPKTKAYMVDVIKDNKGDSGLWNHFLIVKDKCAKLFPDDIDDSSVCLMALELSKNISPEDLQNAAESMIARRIEDENGVFSAWLLNPDTKDDHGVLYASFLKDSRVDIGSCVNFLWFLAKLEMDTRPEILATVNFIAETVGNLVRTKGTVNGMLYYNNRPIIYYLLSRYISASNFANAKFGQAFRELVKAELIEFCNTENQSALDSAAIILAALQIKLHVEEPGDEANLVKESLVTLKVRLIKLQNEDGSFQEGNFYVWFRPNTFSGSKALTTAMVLASLDKLESENL